jgi:TetR/AcrR family transcriptional repressor of lmrAB and yxaGH operons
MARPSDAKTRFIDTAALLFRRQGFNGVGLAEIIEAADAPKGSFYHHFPHGKEQLGEEALRWAAGRFSKALDHVFTDAESFSAGVDALYATVAAWFEASDWRDGCPITSIVLDTVPASMRIHEATQEVLEAWIANVVAHAARLGVKGDLRAQALRILIALEGAWILARVLRSAEPFKLAAAMAFPTADGGA